MNNTAHKQGGYSLALKEKALLEQSPNQETHSIISKLRHSAQVLKIGIHISSCGRITISRWGFSKSFPNSIEALQFLKQIGLN
jgi:hypothetical protein